MSGAIVLGGDCLQVLRDMESESVHAVITDPPYGLSEVSSARLVTALTAWANGDREHVPDGRGFMGKAWDAFVPPPAVWDECMRVLKPGGHTLVFAGSRTVDLMGLSIRLAGFEIRDTLQWLYGSGFPKSLDVSKAIDKLAGAEREVVGRYQPPNGTTWNLASDEATPGSGGTMGKFGTRSSSMNLTAPATDAAREWSGWGTALKPAAEPIILARKPLVGTVAGNVLAHGVGAMNIDACRVGSTVETSGAAQRAQATGEAPPGRWPANTLLSHAPGCGSDGSTPCVEGCPVAELDAQSGTLSSWMARTNYTVAPSNEIYGKYSAQPVGPQNQYGDSGGASRFFPSFRYQAKAPARERPKVDGVSHPTVKPVALMRWLVRLITPPGGTVLDPFAGSGTTLQAATEEGFASIGIERDPDYLKLINARLGFDIAQKDAA